MRQDRLRYIRETDASHESGAPGEVLDASTRLRGHTTAFVAAVADVWRHHMVALGMVPPAVVPPAGFEPARAHG
jgi:hypothetical protein